MRASGLTFLFLSRCRRLASDSKEPDMDKKERVINAIKGEKVDAVPSGFFMHFRHNTVEEHIRFFEETDSDIVKVMNEGKLSDGTEIFTVDEYLDYVKAFGWERYISQEVAFASEVLSAYKGTGFTLSTVHGVAVTAHKLMKGKGRDYKDNLARLVGFYREEPEKTLSALRLIAEKLSLLAFRFKEAGVDGTYYAAFGAEEGYFTDEEFSSVIMPLDREVLASGGYAFLHICRPASVLTRYKSYKDFVDVFNWSVNGSGVSLEEGRKLFGKTILGGLPNQTGPLVAGPEEDIAAQVRALVSSSGSTGFILGADCTIPTGTDTGRIRKAVEAARTVL